MLFFIHLSYIDPRSTIHEIQPPTANRQPSTIWLKTDKPSFHEKSVPGQVLYLETQADSVNRGSVVFRDRAPRVVQFYYHPAR